MSNSTYIEDDRGKSYWEERFDTMKERYEDLKEKYDALMDKKIERRVRTENFVLDLTTPFYLKFFEECRKLSELFPKFLDEEGNCKVSLKEKIRGTCFDKPHVKWKKVRPGHILWHEGYPNGLLGGSTGWWPVRVTRKYNKVVFYRWLDGPLKGKLEHCEQGSLSSDKMFWPYTIKLPKDIRITDCTNPKQIYEYV